MTGLDRAGRNRTATAPRHGFTHGASATCDAAQRVGDGKVIAVHGSVLDLRFPAGALPAIEEAVAVCADPGRPLAAEVVLHLDATTVRAVALENTAGLRRGAAVRSTGSPIRAPVGEPVLGRLLNALGEPTDRGAPLPHDVKRRPIHGPPGARSSVSR